MKLSAVIIAWNEEKNIHDCLASVAFCDERLVVDSDSTDRTVELAASAGARVVKHAFSDYASQKNFGISQAAGEWVLLIDADERVTPGFQAEIQSAIEKPAADGYFIIRKNRIFGRWMRFGINHRDLQLRLVRRDKARFSGRVHERIDLKAPTPCLGGELLHYSTPSIGVYLSKLNRYTTLEAQILNERERPGAPSALRSAAFFLWRYFGKLSLFDGAQGFLFEVLSAYYDLVRRMKAWEIRESKND